MSNTCSIAPLSVLAGTSRPSSQNNTPKATPKASLESQRSTGAISAKHTSSLAKLTRKIVQAAKDHHKSVNAAYGTYYGQGYKPKAGAGYEGRYAY